ncbi:carbohydrate ABC transporter permease [Kribbella antibiotica]|uniref:Carbohydrate ABC transporter permease n=1 Tax=Kribbella antibiotica TaxID=190195 RepID=A0A4R4YVE6_9ACTN|nr:carbohydrate ABC transporter permease [Kribbella antibiotica]TDD48299.1 carbohydrate ABC transporter permease [Kribbella antibiotica]
MTPAYVVRRIGFYVLICAITLFFAVPMVWIASAPFDKNPGLGVHWPDWTFENVRKTLDHPYALHAIVNSLIICVTVALAVTAFAAFASYALSRVRIPGRDALLYGLLLLSSVVTGTAAMVPIFVMIYQLGLINSRFGVALVMTSGLLPAAIFILKDFVDAVPKSYEESARVFGASTLQILRDVVLPVARPGLATIMVWAFVNSWGNFLVPFLLIRSTTLQPAAVLMQTLTDEGGSVNLQVLPVFSLLFSIPVVVLYLLVNSRYGFRFHGGIKS